MVKDATDKAERLFRAAVTAYCSLPRPMRVDTHQLEDLTLSLYDRVSRETLRYVCAALSECAQPPLVLVSRLVEEPPEICAPLLMRTVVLSDVELIALIARKGIGHARVIARRADLHPTIAALAATMERKDQLMRQPADTPHVDVRDALTSELPAAVLRHAAPEKAAPGEAPSNDSVFEQVKKRTVAETRQALRLMMRPSRPVDDSASAYARLRQAALSGSPKLFEVALAHALEIDVAGARSLVDTSDLTGLMAALRTLSLEPDHAYMLMACAFPARFTHAAAIRLFHERYVALDVGHARERLRGLKADALANAFQAHRPARRAV